MQPIVTKDNASFFFVLFLEERKKKERKRDLKNLAENNLLWAFNFFKMLSKTRAEFQRHMREDKESFDIIYKFWMWVHLAFTLLDKWWNLWCIMHVTTGEVSLGTYLDPSVQSLEFCNAKERFRHEECVFVSGRFGTDDFFSPSSVTSPRTCILSRSSLAFSWPSFLAEIVSL